MSDNKLVKRDSNNNEIFDKLCENPRQQHEQIMRYSRREMFCLREKVEQSANRIFIVEYPRVNTITGEIKTKLHIKLNLLILYLVFHPNIQSS